MKYRYLQKNYEKTTKKLRLYYDDLQVCRLQVTTGHYRLLQVTTVTTGTTGFVRKSQSLLMIAFLLYSTRLNSLMDYPFLPLFPSPSSFPLVYTRPLPIYLVHRIVSRFSVERRRLVRRPLSQSLSFETSVAKLDPVTG